MSSQHSALVSDDPVAGGIQAPWLSIILPVHDGEEWIGTTLDSIAEVKGLGVEIVMIDTSATSRTMDLAKSIADPAALRIIDPAGRSGCYDKTNWGVESARGDYVTWLCQDDLWLPGRIDAIREWIAAAPNAILHLAPSVIVDRHGKSLGIWRCPLTDDDAPVPAGQLLERLLVQNFIGVPSAVVRRKDWLACGSIDTTLWYTGDWDLWLKLAQRGEVRYHDDVTAAFRIHGESATSTGSRNPTDFLDQQRLVFDRHINAVAPQQVSRVRRLAEASMHINTALAAVANGDRKAVFQILTHALRLGPSGLWQYLRYSRIMDRLLPRMRAKLAGAL